MYKRSTVTKIQDRFSIWKRDARVFRLNRQLATHAKPSGDKPTVAFFVASTRLAGISLNAAFSYLTACGLQVAGYPVVYFACQAGMSRCVLGTYKDDPARQPPCKACIAQSDRLFAHAPAMWFDYSEDRAVMEAIGELDLDGLSEFEHPLRISGSESLKIPLGPLVLPSLRWALRRHNLVEDDSTLYLLRKYILSAWRVAIEFSGFLDTVDPSVVVVFNGILFPEATARWVARQRGLRVVTHEVGFKPYSAFFTDGDATAYPMEIPDDYELTEGQNARLDDYLEKRFQGKFTMAGIQFWPEMRGLDEDFNRKAKKFRQIVPVFTNVIYDTSQVHANTVFSDMFAWLDMVLELIKQHPETLFVIRAHPDELRPGKSSRESVQEWVEQNRVTLLPNVIFVNSNEYLSSYDLIERSKFILVYNSSIGLEAAILGKAVLCGGEARYTPHKTAYIPASLDDFRRVAEDLMSSNGTVRSAGGFQRNARRVMHFQVFNASLPFGDYLEPDINPGYVRLKALDWHDLKPQTSPTMRTLVDGIIHGRPFLMETG